MNVEIIFHTFILFVKKSGKVWKPAWGGSESLQTVFQFRSPSMEERGIQGDTCHTSRGRYMWATVK